VGGEAVVLVWERGAQGKDPLASCLKDRGKGKEKTLQKEVELPLHREDTCLKRDPQLATASGLYLHS